MKKQSPYSALTKAIVSAPGKAFVAERPYEVLSSGPSGDAFESRFKTLDEAVAFAHRLAPRSAPQAFVRREGKILYTAR